MSFWKRSSIARRSDHSWRLFLRRTVAGQLHLLGGLVALYGTFLLARAALTTGHAADLIACLAFGLSAALVFTVSALYHFLYDGYQITPELEARLEDFDHYAIYLFIAGSYTVFIINTLSRVWQTVLVTGIWIFAIVGILYTRFRMHLPRGLQTRAVYTGLFLLMGWTLLFKIGAIVKGLTPYGLWLLLGGGVAYSVGAVFYVTKRPRLFPGFFGFHELWHACVLIGFVLHYFLVFGFYQIPNQARNPASIQQDAREEWLDANPELLDQAIQDGEIE